MTNILIVVLIVLVLAVIVLLLWHKSQDAPVKKDEIIEALKTQLSAISMDALKAQNEQGAKDLDKKKELIEQELNSKKALIDHTLGAINAEIEKIRKQLGDFDRHSGISLEGIVKSLEASKETSARLEKATSSLGEMLKSSQKRGEWGERMADDLLALAGLKEGVSYSTQKVRISGKPDITLHLPGGLKLNVDVKFPLENYARYVESKVEVEREGFKKEFIKNARNMFKDLGKRDYIDPDGGTVDFAVMFIPNEQAYMFVNDCDHAFADDALRQKIIVCGPASFYAVISVIRQAADNFRMGKTAGRMRELILKFKVQWVEFRAAFDAVDQKIEDLREAFTTLKTTRASKLEVPLREIERMKAEEEPQKLAGGPTGSA